MIGYLVLGVLVMGGVAAMVGGDDDDIDLEEITEDGTSGDDVIGGDASPEILSGYEGNDTITGMGGPDIIFGGDGDDLSVAGSGDDMIFDTEGADTISAGDGNDYIIASRVLDADTFQENLLSDLENGQRPEFSAETTASDETNDGDSAADIIDAGAGDDTILVGAGDVVTGGSGADLIATGAWTQGGDPVVVQDFNPDEDVIVYDYPEGTPEPQLSLRIVGEDAHVLANGAPAIVIEGGAETVSLNNIAVMATYVN